MHIYTCCSKSVLTYCLISLQKKQKKPQNVTQDFCTVLQVALDKGSCGLLGFGQAGPNQNQIRSLEQTPNATISLLNESERAQGVEPSIT